MQIIMRNKKFLIPFLFLLALKTSAQPIITEKKASGAFPITNASGTVSILYDSADDSLMQISAHLLATDVEMVSGKKPVLSSSLNGAKNVIIIGSIGKSALIQQLIREKRLNVTRLQNKWEAYQVQVVKALFKGVDQALVIAGSDRRGAAYGTLELSKQMGVSPWYWWADVPVKKKKEIYVTANAFLTNGKVIPYIGKTASGITTFPVTASTILTTNSAHVMYGFSSTDTGKAKINLYFSPTLNFHNKEEGLQFAVSIDDEAPRTIGLNKEDKNSIFGIWNQWVANNIIIKTSEHQIKKPGKHTIKYWMISPGVVLQKLVFDFGGLKPGYLGPPETKAP